MDNKKLFTVIILSLIFGFLFHKIFMINHPFYIALIIILTFIGTILIYKKINKKRETYKTEYNFKEIDWKNTKRDKDFNEEEKPKLLKKNSLPFDGLNENEMKDRFNYLYYATSHPFKPKSYFNWKINEKNDDEKINSVKHLKLLEKEYPEMTSEMLNAKDCLNEKIGSELSCNQSNSILVQGINKDNKNLVLKEDFKIPTNIKPKIKSQIFKHL